jgi:uncharacterized protein (DUF934 family)
MKSEKIRLFAALAPLLFAACAGTPKSAPTPGWIPDVQTVYPSGEFIAQRREGDTRQDAELAGLNAISFYFESEITAELSSRESWTAVDGETHTESRIEDTMLVQSQTRLMAVRYAEDPWFNAKTKKWETVAYINRDEGWTVYEPQAQRARDALLALAAAAETEAEPFVRALRHNAAQAYAGGAEFNAIRGFAQVLHPAKAAALFAPSDAVISALPEKSYTARQNATVFIDCPLDLDGLVYTAASAAFGAGGFPVSRDRRAASSVCLIRVDEGMQKLEAGTFFYPTLTGTVNGASGALFTFTVQSPRQGAINPDLAKRRAYTALADAFKESFPGELNKQRTSYGN